MKKSKKKKFKTPNRSIRTHLILIGGAIILILGIFIPLMYVSEYNENKVTPFASDIVDKKVDYIDLEDLEEFNLVIYCSEYKDIKDKEGSSNLSSATFKCYVYKNEKTDELKVSNLKLKLAMCSDWISVNQVSSIKPLTIYEDEEKAKSFTRTITITSLPDLPKKGGLPFVKIESIPLYVYLQYDVTVNGNKQTKYNIIKIEYSEYIQNATGGIEK